ncbi:MAG: DUF4838 domain-containing protein [Clostridia bacterium]|nr:DUF4838 domain-containing protein [Clostridia bacterium]
MKRIVCLILVLSVTAACFASVGTGAAGPLPFRDVPENAWYFSPVLTVWEAGIMKGTSADTFSPDDPMTRGQFVTILARLSGDDCSGAAADSPFRDVPAWEYYADPIGWAVGRGIAKGMSEKTFEPESPVLRQEFAAFLVRYIKYKNITLAETETEPFPDAIPDWASADVETLHRAELVAGDPAGRFNPGDRMTRAEIATVIERFMKITDGTALDGYSVVYAEGNEEAAERVAWQIEKLTGQRPAVVTDASPASGGEIVLGATNRGGPDASGLGKEGFEISRGKDAVFVTGETPEGVYRGAAALLKSGTVRGKSLVIPDGAFGRFPYEYPIKSLTVNGRPIADYAIVCPADASESVRTGVADLVKYVEAACGATLEVTHETRSPAIVIEPVEVPVEGSYNNNEENYSIRSEGDDLVVRGSPVRGAMYGCYALLENCVGWYFLTPEVDYIRPAESVDISGVDEVYSPPFEYRSNYWPGAIDSEEFSAKNQLNGLVYSEKYGGGIRYTGGAVHTMQALTNYEYDQSMQPCLNDETIYETVYANVKKILLAHPDARLISVSQNDNGNYCKCEKCAAVAAEEGSESGNVIRFVNRIVRDLRAEGYDKVSIHTLAYAYTVKVCKTKPDPGVIIQYCTAENCFAHPVTEKECFTKGAHAENISAWSEVTSRIWVWDYGTHFSNYLDYNVNYNYRVLCGNIKYFHDHGVSGLFNQGAYTSGTRTGEFSEMRCFLLAKIMEDPDMTEERYSDLMNAFLEGYYGVDSAPFIRDYIDRMIESEKDICDGWMDYDDVTKELTRAMRLKKQLPDFEEDFTNAALLCDSAYAFECVSIDRIQFDYISLEFRFFREFGKGSEEVDREIQSEAFELYEKLKKFGITLTEGKKRPHFDGPEDITVPPSDWKLLF